VTDAQRDDTRIGALLAFSAYMFWGMVTVYWKALDEFDPFELIGWRITTSVVVLVAILLFKRRFTLLLGALRNRTLLFRTCAASVLLTVNWTMFVWAVVNEHVVETALGYFISPILTTVLGVVRLRERLSVLQRTAITFAGIGLLILTIAYGRIPWIALSIAVSWSLYGYLKKLVPLGALESLAAETMVLAVPATLFLAWGWNAETSIATNATTVEWVLVALTGTVTAIPLLLFGAASLRTPLSILGPMQYLVPTIYFLLGWAVYDEAVSAAKLVGFGAIWVCLVLVIVDLFTTQRRTAPALT
jgi:chloramphenicol-sensitive protein RarD